MNDRKTEDAEVLLSALADSIGVYYNATGDLRCFSPAAGANNASSVDADNWNWQVGNMRIVLKLTNHVNQLNIMGLDIEITPVEDPTRGYGRLGETCCDAGKSQQYILPSSQYPAAREPINHITPQ